MSLLPETFLMRLLWIATARTADLLTTWLATPDLRRELNPIVGFLGWYWTIGLSIPLCIALALERDPLFWFGFYFFTGCAIWNIVQLLRK